MTAALLAPTKSVAAAQDVAALIKARNPLIWIVTPEETRVELLLFKAAKAATVVARTWDVDDGVLTTAGKPDANFTDPAPSFGGEKPNFEDPDAVLKLIGQRARIKQGDQGPQAPGLWILRDFPKWLEGPPSIKTLRRLRNLVNKMPGTDADDAQTVIVLSPIGAVPPELANDATVIEWPLPERPELGKMIDVAVTKNKLPALGTDARDAAISAAVGLTGAEAESCFARSIVQKQAIDPHVIANEKKRVIAREGLLQWIDPLPGGLDAVGGLTNLKPWIMQRKLSFSVRAREFGLPPSKGCALLGIPGCGKSLTAKATATGFEVPLLKLDLGSLKSKFVGDSEANIRKALKVIEAIGDCVVWIDEIEKALDGATSGSADGGVSADALGIILTWMQDREGGAFVIATANDATKLPPELLRKGRFDEVWWVDLPQPSERKEILKAALRSKKRGHVEIDYDKIVSATDQFTGAEIAELVPEALFTAFADGEREITTDDLLPAQNYKPLSVTAEKRLNELRAAWKDRVRPASSEEETVIEDVEFDEDDELSGGRLLNLNPL